MNFDISQFHFIRPIWLLLLPFIGALWFFVRRSLVRSNWEDYMPKPVVEALRVSLHVRNNHWQWCLLGSLLSLVFAAAGPTWNKQGLPIVQNQSAMVIVLDLSPSMLAEDLSPNRLTLAKYKLIDILREVPDSQVALVAYSGDAHTVSPLTDDPRTIESLLPALHPNIMPSAGSNIESAVELANQLLSDAGAASGDVILISDGIAKNAIATLKAQWNTQHRFSILAVGGEQGAPIPRSGGGFLRNSQGEIVLASVDHSIMRGLAYELGGRFAVLGAGENDIESLLTDRFEASDSEAILEIDDRFDAWEDLGYLFIFIALPLLLVCFRKGLIYSLPLIFLVPIDDKAIAQTIGKLENSPTVESSPKQDQIQTGFWSSLWTTKDQQAAKLYDQKKFAEAAEKFKRKDWSAIADYRAGNYEKAASTFNEEGATNLYNKGNALALAGDLEASIKTYEQVLELDKDHQDAAHNKEVVERLLQQSQQESQENQEGNDQQKQDSSQNEESQSNSQPSESNDESDSTEQSQSSEPAQADQDSTQDTKPQPDQEPQPNQEPQPKDEPDQNPASEQDKDSQKTDEQVSQSAIESSDEPKKEGEEGDVVQLNPEQSDQQLKDSSEQWLRSIADDPSGLLRRKFEYQSKQGNQQKQTNNNDQERF